MCLKFAVVGCGPAGLIAVRRLLATYGPGIEVHLFGDIDAAQPLTRKGMGI
jgi:protoporphyrinogen oxidase